MQFPAPARRKAVVESAAQLTPKVYAARFSLAEPQEMEFLAGQYGSFILGPQTRRTFSFTTNPAHRGVFELAADVTPMGPGSIWLMDLKAGDTVDFLGPLGRFVIDYESPRKPIFIATGTGIAPIRSMIYEYLEKGEKRELTLYWGLRFEQDMFWQEEFIELSKKYRHFQYQLTLSQPSENWQGLRGRVTDHVFSHADDLANYDFYICGNRAMIHEVKEELISRNVPESQIKEELFF